MRHIHLAAALWGALLICAPSLAQPVEPEEPSIQRGRALVAENCSGCHAIGADGKSPHEKAPPFHTLGERFPIDALEETFIESIDTGHPGMPVFLASPQQIADILDYIASVMEE